MFVDYNKGTQLLYDIALFLRCATSWKDTGSIPDEVFGFFS
jgi:hypothetical protein